MPTRSTKRSREKKGRAENDAYWTPLPAAIACCKAARDELPRLGVAQPTSIRETGVGGGAWVVGSRKAWPDALVHRLDLNGELPGMVFDVRPGESVIVQDYFEAVLPPVDMILGNPAYGERLGEWLEKATSEAPLVGYLLRGTALGSFERFDFWTRCPPAICWVLVPRPQWGGPGARKETDSIESVFALWVRGYTDTRLRWLRWREGQK